MRTRVERPLLSALFLAASLAACNDGPTLVELLPITGGTVGGIPFTVLSGSVFQSRPDGPIYAPMSGGQILLTGTPSSLGMSDPNRLQLRARVALAHGGDVLISAFGDGGTNLDPGLSVTVLRDAGKILYELRSDGALLADSTFVPDPPIPSAELWVVSEFYAEDVPGYGAGQSGIALWPLDDVTPALGDDVLGCTAGPAIDAGNTHPGEAVSLFFTDSWIVSLDVVDQIVGPCV